MPVNESPKVSLEYAPETGEFTVKVTPTTRVSYTLEYDWDNGEELSGTDALINTADADNTFTFTDTQLAGTESNSDKFVHVVTNGVLTLSADTKDGEIFSYEGTFKITESGKVKILNQQTSQKPASELSVLGESSASAELASTSGSVLEPQISKPVTKTTAIDAPIAAANAANPTMLPIAIGIGVGIVVASLLATWFYKKNQHKKPSLMDEPSPPPMKLV